MENSLSHVVNTGKVKLTERPSRLSETIMTTSWSMEITTFVSAVIV